MDSNQLLNSEILELLFLLLLLFLPHSEEDALVAMLRFQEFERSTVDTEGAMGLAAILAGQLPELRGKKWVRLVNIMVPVWTSYENSLHSRLYKEVRDEGQRAALAKLSCSCSQEDQKLSSVSEA